MSEQTPPRPPARPITPVKSALTPLKLSTDGSDDKVPCERCGAEMYRMHAVWRCSACGYKTDCGGW